MICEGNMRDHYVQLQWPFDENLSKIAALEGGDRNVLVSRSSGLDISNQPFSD